MAPVKPKFFATPALFGAWLAKNHLTSAELLVGFHKKDSGKASMTWPESVDEALCHGWIDGVRRSLDETSYTIRFTPRRQRSIWSSINIARMKVLIEQGRVMPAGRAAFERRSDDKSSIYAYEQRQAATLTPAQEKQFRANRKAWAFFNAQAPSYQGVMVYHIVSAKREETKRRRLAALIEISAQEKRAL
jgi:uncharacterized protein YdeI (YjbR/CyaY-like superfamily)